MDTPTTPKEAVNHPQHYGGDTPYEAIKVIEAWNLDFCLGNTVKYISRAGKKSAEKEVEDLLKARWYLERRLQQLGHKEEPLVVEKKARFKSAVSPDGQWMFRLEDGTWVDLRTHENFSRFLENWKSRVVTEGNRNGTPVATSVTLLFDVPVDMTEMMDAVNGFCSKWSMHRGFLLRPIAKLVNRNDTGITDVMIRCSVQEGKDITTSESPKP
jgi:hypothetical protein